MARNMLVKNLPTKDQSMTNDNQDTYEEFNNLVNMSPSEIEKWLDSDESGEVGFIKEGAKESQGRKSAKKIIEIKRKHKADLTEDDYSHMSKVISYIKRHLAQKPDKDVTETPWRYSLKNWGHEPLQ
jgi:hypothetical protein